VTKTRQLSRGQKVFVIMAAFVCGLLFYANGIAFNIISTPVFVNDIIAFGTLGVAVVLTVITLMIVVRDIRRIRLLRIKKSNVDTVVQKDHGSDTVSLPIITQKIVNKAKPDIVAFETAKLPDGTPSTITPPTKVFKKRNLFVIIVAFIVVGLLFFANAVAFGLISLPAYSIYAAVVGAVTLIAIAVTMLSGEKIKSLGNRIKSVVAEPQIQDIINEYKETDQTPETAPAPVIAQKEIKKVDPCAELFRQYGFQKASTPEADTVKQEKSTPKVPVILRTKVICPACRKEIMLPDYMKEYVVDFGPPRKSNITKICPSCQASVPLKRIGVLDEEEIWKE
jgi:hypothetical protein